MMHPWILKASHEPDAGAGAGLALETFCFGKFSYLVSTSLLSTLCTFVEIYGAQKTQVTVFILFFLKTSGFESAFRNVVVSNSLLFGETFWYIGQLVFLNPAANHQTATLKHR